MGETENSQKKKIFYPGEEHWVIEKGHLHLVGSHCEKCGQNYFPAREICPKCFVEGEMERIPLSRHGKLYSFSILRVAPRRFIPPYAVGYVDFPEGVRVLGQLTTIDPSQLKLDMETRIELGRIAIDEQGNEVISYKFGPL